MAIRISFKLRNPQTKTPKSKQKDTPIIMMVNFGYYELIGNKKKYNPLKYSTKEKIKPCQWNGTRAKNVDGIENDNFNTRLDNLENTANNIITDLRREGIYVTPELLKNKLDEKENRIIKPKIIKQDLNSFIETFIQGLKTGKILVPKKKTAYRKGTIKNYEGFQTQFNLYQEKNKCELNYEDINEVFYDDFVNFFTNKNYSPNTIGRHIKSLKVIMKKSFDKGLHNNTETTKEYFITIEAKIENIYLTETELQRMYELDLSDKPNYEIARDVFIVGSYIAQRYSDYSRITKNQIKKLDNGQKVIDIKQVKTGERVIIPIRKEVETILKKYDYSLPKTHEQKVNKYIKKVGKKAVINELINCESYKGGLLMKTKVPKYDLIQTHTARRSGCTNMYLAKIPTIEIMKISGHKTEREFLKYIKIGKEETATKLSNHKYFNNHLKVAK